jgi:hypothetical protein
VPRPAGAKFPRVTLLLRGGRRKSNADDAYIEIKNKYVVGISITFYIPIETINRPPQSRETITLNS